MARYAESVYWASWVCTSSVPPPLQTEGGEEGVLHPTPRAFTSGAYSAWSPGPLGPGRKLSPGMPLNTASTWIWSPGEGAAGQYQATARVFGGHPCEC